MEPSSLPVYSPPLEDLLDPNPPTVAPETCLMDAIALMSQSLGSQCVMPGQEAEVCFIPQRSSSCVLVVEDNRLVGILTERDVVRLTAGGSLGVAPTVEAVMTHDVVTLARNNYQDIFSILSLLRRHRIRHLPVVNEAQQLLGVITPQTLRSLLQPMNLLRLQTVSEAMNREVVWALPDYSILNLAKQMTQHRVSCVVILQAMPAGARSPHTTNEPGLFKKPIGIVTERDIVQYRMLELDLAKTPARDIMSAPLFCLNINDSMWTAHQQMEERRVRRLVVVDDRGNLAGIVTQTNLLRSLDPIELYGAVDTLQQRIFSLEQEKLTLLQHRSNELEHQVQQATNTIQQQATYDRLLAETAANIRQSLNLQEILNTTVTQVRQLLDCDRTLVYRFDPNWSGTIMAESVREGCQSLLGQTVYDLCFAPDWVDPYTNGHIRAISDIYNAGITPCHAELLARLQIRANLVVPIVWNQTLWGLLTANHCHAPREWQGSEIELLKKLATQVGIAIQQSELYQQAQVELQQRQQAEKALQQERHFASAIMQAAGALVCVLDCEGQIVRFNQACEALTGYTCDEVLGCFIWDLFLLPEEIDSLRQVFYALKTTKAPSQHENYWVAKDGSHHLIAWSNAVLLSDRGEVEFVIGTGTDVTERRKLETAMRNVAAGVSAKTGEDFFQSLVQYLAHTLGVRYAFVGRLQPEGDRIATVAVTASGQIIENFEYQLMGTPCEQVVHQQTLDLCAYPTNIQQLFPKDRMPIDMDVESYLGIPLENSQGQVAGLMCVLDSRPMMETRFAAEVMRIFASRAAAELEREQNQEKLQAQEQFLRTLIDTDPSLIFVKDWDGRYVWANQALASFYGKTPAEIVGSRDIHLYSDPDIVVDFLQQNREIIDSRQEQFIPEEVQVDATGNERYFQWLKRPFFLSGDETCYVLGVGTDISDRKYAELALQKLNEDLEQKVVERTTWLTEANRLLREEIQKREAVEKTLRESQERLQLALEASGDGLWDWNLLTGEIYLSLCWLKMLGYSENELPGYFTTWESLVHPEDKPWVMDLLENHLQNSLVPYQFDYRLRAKSGKWKWIANFGKVVARDRNGKPLRMIGIHRDISDRKQAEEKIQASLQEKELLLKEIHHRVKNNLLVAASLLELQSDYVKDPTILQVLNDSQNRIHSMALIHEKLYRSEDISKVNFSSYLQDLIDSLCDSYGGIEKRIKFELDLEPIHLNIETAHPCGLIIHELISNIFKHAFPGGRSGQVWIRLSKDLKGKISVLIGDNGIGFPANLDFQNTESLGMELVCTLTKQLGGAIALDRSRGTAFLLQFSELQYRKRFNTHE